LKDGAAAAVLLRKAGLSKGTIRSACAATPPPLYPGVEDTLDLLRADRVRLGAVTNLPKWLHEPMLAAHRGTLDFETVVGWGDAPRKPRPEPLEIGIRKLGLEPGAGHWYVGDTQSDASATEAAGLSFAWASWGYADACPAEADRSLERFADVGELP
jgi:phosphoglycolate phosphatase